MRFEPSCIAGLGLIELNVRGDARGAFMRLYCQKEMAAMGVHQPIVQINQSITGLQGTVRGLHFQLPPVTETKIIRCVRGAVWDVAVDLRAGSPTFLQWQAYELSAHSHRLVVIPDGFAHGFQTLTPDAELIYLHTAFYTPEHERGFSAVDPRVNITWPLPIAMQSDRDRQLPCVPGDFEGIRVPH